MKILILSVCGRSDEPDDTKRINLYLASLKKYIVPFFETKVILLNTAISKEKTVDRVKEFGLENIVDVRLITEMELPENSVKYWKSLAWHPRVPLNMNMLYDYAKKNDFFEAEWIFHADTDLEFLSNFKDNLQAIHQLTNINPKGIITLAGDTYPYFLESENKSFIFDEPNRVNLYEENQTFPWNTNLRQIRTKEKTENVLDVENVKFTFHLQQQKTRNDLFGFTKTVGVYHTFDWNHAYTAFDGHPELIEFQKRMSSKNINISTSHDKGTLVQFQLQTGHEEINRTTLRVDRDMARHYGPGWSTEDMTTQSDWNFVNISKRLLEEQYAEYKHIWGNDYE